MSGPKINHSSVLIGLFALTSLTSCFNKELKKTENPFPENSVGHTIYDRKENRDIKTLSAKGLDQKALDEDMQMVRPDIHRMNGLAAAHGLKNAQVIDVLKHVDSGKLDIALESEIYLLQFDGKEMQFMLDALKSDNIKGVGIHISDTESKTGEGNKAVIVDMTDAKGNLSYFVYNVPYEGFHEYQKMEQAITAESLVTAGINDEGIVTQTKNHAEAISAKDNFHAKIINSVSHTHKLTMAP